MTLSLFAALIPAALFGWFVNWLDQHEKEPWWLLALAFAWGAIPAFIIAVVAQLLLDIPTTRVLAEESLAHELAGGSLWAPITEEMAKGLGVLLVLLLVRREIDNLLDGIVYGAMTGLGFAFTENLFYFGGALAEEGWGGWVLVILLRTIPFGLNHAFFSGLVGAGLGAAYISTRSWVKIGAPLGGLTGGMLFHSIHNLGASLAATSCLIIGFSLFFDWTGILMLGVLVALVWRQEKAWMVEHLAGEVTDEVYRIVISWRRWMGTRWGALAQGDTRRWRELGRLRQAASELALKKKRLAHRGPDPRTEAGIQRYRARLAELGATPVGPVGGSFEPIRRSK